ncbi:uncharacterized protein LOC118430243 [Branchiostoma floridae]|uniref:Uncharacterized protein LOC118430243 n=1 Tax=Branchiostoma floridae TaxID=7739 RepID=A0A9J7NBH1_BRAFL|nr:uncharacterized protein LOC118430243 [Branchiostoma floridae]
MPATVGGNHYSRAELLKLRGRLPVSGTTKDELVQCGIWHARGCRAGRKRGENIQVVTNNRPKRYEDFKIVENMKARQRCLTPIRKEGQPLVGIRADNNNKRLPMPKILLINARSLCNKMEECSILLHSMNIHVAVITETWFDPDLPDAQWDIDGYHLFSKPRQGKKGGGVAIYVNNNIQAQIIDVSIPADLECLWIKMRPPRLPRELSSVVVCAVYIPPGSPHSGDLINHLLTVVDELRSTSPDVGLCIAGDFNRTDLQDICRGNQLRQIVDVPTRMDATLDCIITNPDHLYLPPALLSPLGSSDHNIVHLVRSRVTRPMPDSRIRSFGQWLVSHDWYEVLTADDVQTKTNNFYHTLVEKLNQHFPAKVCQMHTNDKPWLSPNIKTLMKQRQQAFKSGENDRYKELRNKVQRIIKRARGNFYKDKVKSLKKENPSKWYQMLKSMTNTTRRELTLNIEGTPTADHKATANAINEVLCAVTCSLEKLDLGKLPVPPFLPAKPIEEIQPWEVYNELRNINTRKAAGPDDIPNRTIKEFSYEISTPLTHILNASLAEGVVTVQWRQANIVPLPKSRPPSIEELRPISLTPVLAKVVERFVATRLYSDIKENIDPTQFGCLAGRSTTHCLVYYQSTCENL